MKNFFLALITVALVATSHVAAADLTAEQLDEIISRTAENSAAESGATLPVDAETFQKNFNAFVINFIRETDAGYTDASMMKRIFLLNDAKTFTRDGHQLFAKNFLNRALVVGLSDGGKCKVLNFFATHAENRDDALFNVLVLQAFVRGIAPEFDAMNMLAAAEKNPSATVIRDGVKYSVVTDGNTDIVTAVAAD